MNRVVDNDYRARLLAGMADAIAEEGYADVTVADIVRHARVSKRTFYDCFATKEACLLALYEVESSRLLDEIDASIQGLAPGRSRIAAGAAVYLARLQSHPRVVRTLWIEILHLGAKGLEIRRRVMRRFAALLMREFEATEPTVSLSPAVAMAIVGGINELALEAFEENRLERLGEIAVVIAELFEGILRVPRV